MRILSPPRADAFGLSFAFSSDGRFLATGDQNGVMTLWNVAAAQSLRSIQCHSAPLRAIAFGVPGSDLLFTAGDDHLIVMHDIRSFAAHSAESVPSTYRSDIIHTFVGHSGYVLSLSACPDGRLLASSSTDGTVKIWDIPSRKCVHTQTEGEDIWSVRWRPLGVKSNQGFGGQAFVIGTEGGHVKVFRSASA